MKKLTKELVGKTLKCGEEWYGGFVFYVGVYQSPKGDFLAERKVYVNSYTNKIEREKKMRKCLCLLGLR